MGKYSSNAYKVGGPKERDEKKIQQPLAHAENQFWAWILKESQKNESILE